MTCPSRHSLVSVADVVLTSGTFGGGVWDCALAVLVRRENSQPRSWSTTSRCNEICKSRGQLGTAGQVRMGQETYTVCRPGRVRLTDETSSFLRPAADAGQRAYLYGLETLDVPGWSQEYVSF